MSEQVKKNLLSDIKMYVGRGSVDKIHRIFVHWINRADSAEQRVKELEKENLGQSDLIERLLAEAKTLKQNNEFFKKSYKERLEIESEIAEMLGLEVDCGVLERIADEVMSLKQQNAALKDMLDRGGE